MRIFYDHQVFSLQDAGGASRYHFELIRNLQANANFAIDALLGLNNSVMPFASLRQATTRITSRKTGIRPGAVRYAANELQTVVAAPLLGEFDIYHPTLYRALPWVRRRRVVVTHHDCIHERFPHLFADAASIIRAKNKLFQQADAIICVSASSQRDLLHFYDGLEKKTYVVHHGFSPLESAPEDGDSDVNKLRPYLLYVGSRAGYKNFSLLLEAFASSGLTSEYRLLAVGGGGLTTAEHERIAALRLAGSVTIIPKANDTVLAGAYRNAALFVYPTLYEGFGFPPLEAMSLGCPVLVNRISSLPEICGDAAFYFAAPDVEELARSLVSTLGDSQGLSTRKALGRQQIGRYDWHRTARSTLDVYRSVLHR